MERLQWRRNNEVLELSSQGRSQPEIATTLQVGLGTVSRDVQYLRPETTKGISKVYDWFKPGAKDGLGYCPQ